MMIQGGLKGVSNGFQVGFKGVKSMYWAIFFRVSRVIKRCFNYVSKVILGILNVFLCCFKGSLRVFEGVWRFLGAKAPLQLVQELIDSLIIQKVSEQQNLDKISKKVCKHEAMQFCKIACMQECL